MTMENTMSNMVNVKVQLVGNTVRLFDMATNRDLKSLRFTAGSVARIERLAAQHGWTLTNVRNGRIWL
jgi:hypothetical protein